MTPFSYRVPTGTSAGCVGACGSGGSYAGPPLPAPLGIGAGGAYRQQPIAYVSSGSRTVYGTLKFSSFLK
ncbi:unnamed protein product [Acanthocheilonema viteae]|uniref:Uncharacterized protein n=1 Tax=Acanthocheilonema viteae TaxID=6277 RepID=A0A498SSK1_ACAVI|nr:unnamed protein product [Acanthocheilonema viteae]